MGNTYGSLAHVAIFLAAPWKGLTYVFRFFKSDSIFALPDFPFLLKWLLCLVMQFSISFYSLILFGVQVEYGK